MDFELVDEGGYRYEPLGAYVNFAAKALGGGVLGHGFVQEERATFESNLLPLLFCEPPRSCGRRRSGARA